MPSSETQNTDLKKLFSFQMRRFHVLYVRTSTLIYANRFGLTLNECLMMTELLPYMETRAPLARLIAETSFDNALATRIISSLIAKGMVMRTVNAADARVREISFTPKGKRVGAEIRSVIEQRDARLMARLSQADRKRLQNAMEALIDEAGLMLEEEKARTGGQRKAV